MPFVPCPLYFADGTGICNALEKELIAVGNHSKLNCSGMDHFGDRSSEEYLAGSYKGKSV